MHANPFVTRPPAAMSLSYGWLTTEHAPFVSGCSGPSERIVSPRTGNTFAGFARRVQLLIRKVFAAVVSASRVGAWLRGIHEMMAMLLKAKPEGGGRWIAKPPRGARMARRTSTMRLPPLAGRIWVHRMRRYLSAIEANLS